MEALTRAIWDFMEGSYRKGVLDELLGLVGALSDPEVDLGKQLGDFEDRLSDADFGVFEEMSTEVLTPLLQALADEKVLESLHVLLITTRPLIDAFMERVGGDTNVASEMLGLIKQNLVCLKTVAVALTPVLAKVYGPTVETFIKERGGALAADLINTASAGDQPESGDRNSRRLGPLCRSGRKGLRDGCGYRDGSRPRSEAAPGRMDRRHPHEEDQKTSVRIAGETGNGQDRRVGKDRGQETGGNG